MQPTTKPLPTPTTLADLEEARYCAERADNWAFTNGTIAAFDRMIAAERARLSDPTHPPRHGD